MERFLDERKQDLQLGSFTREKFKLNLVTELSKFFIPKFAAKIQFSLYSIHASEKTAHQELKSQIKTILDEIWRNHSDIKSQLFKYYRTWNRIRHDFFNWKKEQKKEEVEKDSE